MAASQKQAIIVGGPNGAGKTTFVNEFLRDLPYRYIGADLIAAQIAPDQPESVAFDAGRKFMLQIDKSIESGEDVIVETTMSGKSFRNVMATMKQRGYLVSAQCIFLKSPESHIIRVAERVRGGGHHVPDDDVIRRFTRSLRNFWHLYRPLADKWDLFYNDERRYVHVALGDPGAYLVIEEDLFELFRSHAS